MKSLMTKPCMARIKPNLVTERKYVVYDSIAWTIALDQCDIALILHAP